MAESARVFQTSSPASWLHLSWWIERLQTVGYVVGSLLLNLLNGFRAPLVISDIGQRTLKKAHNMVYAYR